MAQPEQLGKSPDSELAPKLWSTEQVLLSEDRGTTERRRPAVTFPPDCFMGIVSAPRTRGVGKIENVGLALKWRARDSAYVYLRNNPE
jgi:hypothetical protein